MQLIDTQNLTKTAEQAARIVSSGGIVIAPFDTVYGIIADPRNEQAIERIFVLKDRPVSKTLGLAADTIESVEEYAEIKDRAYVADRTPGRYTFILEAKTKVLNKNCYRGNTIAFRIPESKLILGIAEKCGGIIAQTSANRSGEPNCLSVDDLRSQFGDLLDHVDLTIDGGIIENGQPSKLIDLTGDTPREIER